MKTAFLIVLLSASVLRADSGEFARSSTFASVKAFVTVASRFQPAKSKSDLSALFEMETDPKSGKPIIAKAIRSAVALWSGNSSSGNSSALVFITAKNFEYQVAPSAVGVLFLIERKGSAWQIVDFKRFVAGGKYAEVSAELTSVPGRGLDEATIAMPVVTITENDVGGGGGYRISASYALVESKLKLMTLE